MAFAIQLQDGGAPSYWSLKNPVNPSGQWVADYQNGIWFARKEDAESFVNIHLRHQQELIRVIPCY